MARLLAAAACAAALIGLAADCGEQPLSVDRERAADATTVAPAALARALSTFSGEYGRVTDVSEATASTMGRWRRSEPGNTSGYGRDAHPDDAAVHAAVVSGDFEVAGPMQASGEEARAAYDRGRIVFDEAGDLLNVRMWSSSSPVAAALGSAAASSPFGSAFDDR
jgi:hypothetical protein